MKILDAMVRFAFYVAGTIFCALAIFVNLALSLELRYPEMMGESIWGYILMISAGVGILINLAVYSMTKKFRKSESPD